jgi:hypothetical protein
VAENDQRDEDVKAAVAEAERILTTRRPERPAPTREPEYRGKA